MHSILTIGVVLLLVVISVFVVVTLFRFLWNTVRRIFGRAPAPRHP